MIGAQFSDPRQTVENGVQTIQYLQETIRDGLALGDGHLLRQCTGRAPVTLSPPQKNDHEGEKEVGQTEDGKP